MAQSVFCPKCQCELNIPEEAIGKSVQCPKCEQVFQGNISGRPTPLPVPTSAPVPEPKESWPSEFGKEGATSSSAEFPSPKKRKFERAPKSQPKESLPKLPSPVSWILTGLLASICFLTLGIVTIVWADKVTQIKNNAVIVVGPGGFSIREKINNWDLRDPRRNAPCKIFEVQMKAGVTYQIDMKRAGMGSIRDPYLRVENPQGMEVAANDDFMGLDSRIVYQAPQNGVFRIYSSCLGSSIGSFDFSILEGVVNPWNQPGMKK